MSRPIDNSPSLRAWYHAAVASAVVAGSFCLVLGGLLVANLFGVHGKELRDANRLNALKAELFAQPGNEQLRRRSRRLDLELRSEYFRRRRRMALGARLLLAGAAVFLAASKLAASLAATPPHPRPLPAESGRQSRSEHIARWSVGATGGGFLVAAVVLGITARPIIGPGIAQPPKGAQVATAPAPAPPTFEEIEKNWPRFRGPRGAGIWPHADVPESWDGRTGRNILWKAPVPLPGNSSPILWGGRVFLTGADKARREVYCFDAASGKLLWKRQVKPQFSPAKAPEVMDDTGFAASTPVTDGRRICAIFANGDLACFDLTGREIWSRALGLPENTYGFATSLAMWRDLVLIQFDQAEADDRRSQLIALQAATGKVAWVADRPVPDSWSSPIVIAPPGGPQVITCADPWVIAYDPGTGRELWRAECLGGDVAPSPVYAAGLVFAVNADAALAAIRPDGRGVVTRTHVVWKAEDGLPDVCSPLADGKRVYLLTTDGTLTCYRAADGRKLWQHEFDDTFYASPALAGGRLYITSQTGRTWVLAAADKFEQLTAAELGEKVNASMAFANGRIYIRGHKHLFCIGGKESRNELKTNPPAKTR